RGAMENRSNCRALRNFHSGALRVAIVVKAKGTRICAVFDMSPHSAVASGVGFFTTKCSFPAPANLSCDTRNLILVPLWPIVGAVTVMWGVGARWRRAVNCFIALTKARVLTGA